jgi:hypothetical protein
MDGCLNILAVELVLTKSVAMQVSFITGQLCTEVRQTFAPWAVQTFRLCKGSHTFDVEWTVGPVPIDDGLGKEIISRFTTNIESQAKLLTDSNGRDMLERQRCVQSPVPKPTWISIFQCSHFPHLNLNPLPVSFQVFWRRRHDLSPQRAWISCHRASSWKLFPRQYCRSDP